MQTAGCYTLRATSPANETYRDGLAIKRLNVYRHLDVTVDGEEHVYPTPIYTDKEGGDLHVEIAVPDPTHLFFKLVDLNAENQPGVGDSDYDDCEPGFSTTTQVAASTSPPTSTATLSSTSQLMATSRPSATFR